MRNNINVIFVGEHDGKATSEFYDITQDIMVKNNINFLRYKNINYFREILKKYNEIKSNKNIIVLVYCEDYEEKNNGQKMVSDFLNSLLLEDECKRTLDDYKIIHPVKLGKILGDKKKTNELLSKHNILCPDIIKNSSNKIVFSNQRFRSNSDVIVHYDDKVDESLYNTEYIDTSFSYNEKRYYASIRTMCVGKKCISIYIRLRDCNENKYSVHTKDTPLDCDLINAYYEENILPYKNDIEGICSDIGNLFGLGFYAHDLLFCHKSKKFYVCESGFKFNDYTFNQHIKSISDTLFIPSGGKDCIKKSISEFINQIKTL